MHSIPFRAWLSLALVLALLEVSAPAGPCAEVDGKAQGEAAPTFRASDLLVSEVLRGPNYEIEEFVQVEHYKYFFKIHTEWGTVPAHGMNMLELKLREMYAIENARKWAKDPQFVQAVFTMVKNTPQGVRLLLTEPEGALLRAPVEGPKSVRWKYDPA